MIYRKNNYNKIDYIIKLLKEKNFELDNYRQEAKNILSIENIKNYSLYIDEKYLNKKRIRNICTNCNKYHYVCKKTIVTIFQKKITI